MRGYRGNVTVAAAFLFAMGLAIVAPAQAQAPPSSLIVRYELPLFFSTGTPGLKPDAAADGDCGNVLTTARADSSFSSAPLANGTDYWFRDDLEVEIYFAPPPDAPQYVSSGFTLNVTLSAGPKVLGSQQTTVEPGSAPPQSAKSFTFEAPEPPNATNGQLKVDINLTPSSAADLGAANNVMIKCGTDGGSNVKAFEVVRGQPGDGDVNSNGNPDSTDPDIDGDGFPNEQEIDIACGDRHFETDPRLKPEGDSDGDGFSDVEECEANTDPTRFADAPPPPPEFPWDLLILGIILLLLVVGILAFFFVFGKAVTVTLLSTPELIIPPGGEGKFEVRVASLRPKGNPVNFQLLTQGVPEGWDAKLSVDHVVLDPKGGAKNAETVWLTVEAPEHPDPESAVVKVKAIALNAAGRKDTFKLPASARTITSINVPPNAKVPVKRGAAVKLKTEKQAAKPTPAAAPEVPTAAGGVAWTEKDRPVVDIEGIGEVYTTKLKEMGIETVQQLHAVETKKVAKKTGANATVVDQWKSMAELIDVEGVGPQYAELLVRAGVSSIAQLATSDPSDLHAAVEKAGEGREVRIQGGPAGLKSAKNWVKAAGKHPLGKAAKAAPAPVPGPEPATPTPAAAPAAAKPALQVGGLAHAPPTFRQGEEVKSSVTVTNNGEAAQKLKLSLYVNDNLADAQTVDVKPGKSKEVKFKWVAQERNKLNIRGEVVPG